MPDQRALIAALTEYRAALARQADVVRGEFTEVERAWLLLGECFEGTAADEFRAVWEAAAARFREYADGAAAVGVVLADRTDHLREADRPTDLPG